ncbi:sigma-70 family RNA polymerase sigma factor [Ramlibacter sp.]|uniref:sigma-70 family RNA polymerase sigma factor n=1 Tax=Ramlibacter sp. TaxID=1917967 RepID=UPI003D0E87D6
MDWKERAEASEHRLRALFRQALAGDAVAYREFLAALAAHLRPFFRRRLTHFADDVEDLVQETLLAVHGQRHTYRPQEPLTAWVHGIARYKLVDLLRSKSRREALHVPFDDELELFAHSEAEATESKRDLDRMLQTLPERQRRALVMTKLEGASVAEAAGAIGMSEGALRVGVHRSLKALMARARGQA